MKVFRPETIHSDCGCASQAEDLPLKKETTPIVQKYPQKVYTDIRADIKFDVPWNIPQCGVSVYIPYNKANEIPVGAYLWSSKHGFFQVARSAQNEIALTNTCTEGNGEFGALVEPGDSFILKSVPINTLALDTAYLDTDFIAPPRGECTTTRFSSLDGIAPGMQIRLSTGNYFFKRYLGGGIAELCENGGGLEPGTLVPFENAFGARQVPITPMSSSIVLQSISSGDSGLLDQNITPLFLGTSLTLKNPYIDKSMTVTAHLTGRVSGSLRTTDSTLPVAFNLGLVYQLNRQAMVNLVNLPESHAIPAGVNRAYSQEIKMPLSFNVPADSTINLTAALTMSWVTISEEESARLDLDDWSIEATALGVLV